MRGVGEEWSMGRELQQAQRLAGKLGGVGDSLVWVVAQARLGGQRDAQKVLLAQARGIEPQPGKEGMVVGRLARAPPGLRPKAAELHRPTRGIVERRSAQQLTPRRPRRPELALRLTRGGDDPVQRAQGEREAERHRGREAQLGQSGFEHILFFPHSRRAATGARRGVEHARTARTGRSVDQRSVHPIVAPPGRLAVFLRLVGRQAELHGGERGERIARVAQRNLEHGSLPFWLMLRLR